MDHYRYDGQNTKPQVLIHPDIGLDGDIRHSIVEILNKTLANEVVLTQKTRVAHWSVGEKGFSVLRTLFGFQFKKLNETREEISNRTRLLGGTPITIFEEFFGNSRLIEKSGYVSEIIDLLADHESLIRFLRADIRECEEVITHAFLVDILCLHEKMAWMLRAYIEPVLIADCS